MRGRIRTTVAAAVIGCIGCAASNGAVAPVSSPVPASTRPSIHVAPPEIATPPAMPSFQESEEASPAELDGALDEGKSLRREIEWVGSEESVASGEMAAGEYLVAYLITPADDYYDLEAAQSNLPAHHTTVAPGSAHVAVVVRDAADGRVVQGLTVRAVLRSDDSDDERTAVLPFGWHPILNRYGENLVLPPSPFTLRVYVTRPSYARHDSTNGDRFTRDVMAKFTHVVVSSDSLATMSERLARGESREAVNLSRAEGGAIDHPLAELLRSVGTSGSQERSGDYRVAVIVRHGRGAWKSRNGKLGYEAPDANIGPVSHIDVIIRDAVTGRFIPGLKVRVTVLNARKREIDTYSLPFMWHPWLNHYGLNIPDPGKGRYTIRVHADAPALRRYGSTALRKFNKPVDASIRNIRFDTDEAR